MGVKVTNNAFGTLSASISTSDTTIVLDGGQGARFPTLGSGDFFFGTIVDTANNLEIVKVTARSTDSMTVVRAQDNTTARAFAIGDRFELRPTAALFNQMLTDIDNAGVDGIVSSADATAMTIDSSERIGIGTSNPSANLEVAAAAPTLILNADSQATNKKKVRLAASQVSAGDFHIQNMQDDGTTLVGSRFITKDDGTLLTGPNNFIDVGMSGGNSTDAFNVSGVYGNGSKFNWYQPSFYGTGYVNRTYRKMFYLSGDNCWVYFTGGGGNTVFGTYAYISAQHYRDAAVWSVTLYYSDLKIKVVTDGNANKTIYVAGDTYQNNLYNLQWRVFPIHSSATLTMNPSGTESNGYLVHHASGGEQFSSSSSLTSGTGPSTY